MSDWEEEIQSPAGARAEWPAAGAGRGRFGPGANSSVGFSGSSSGGGENGFGVSRMGHSKGLDQGAQPWSGGDSLSGAGRGIGNFGDRGPRSCFKCGQSGHIARECPSSTDGSAGSFGARPGAGGFSARPDGNSRGCHKCGESGHFARECPQQQGGGPGWSGGSRENDSHFSKGPNENGSSRGSFFGGGTSEGFNRNGNGSFGNSAPRSSGCHKCGEDGHFARECPNAGSAPGSGSFGNLAPRSLGCHKCGEEGHFARECPNAGSAFGNTGSSGNSAARISGCHKCGQEGHFARECMNGGTAPAGGAGNLGGSATRGTGCRICGQDGHFARECPNPESATGRPKVESYIPPEYNDDDTTSAAGINFDSYDAIPVEFSGRDAVKAISSFDEAGLLETLRQNVSLANYTKPTPVQKYAIPTIMAGRDLMACAQTGSGKTAAFLLPVIAGIVANRLTSSGSAMAELQEPAALVIAPTRELADQIHKEARKFSRGTIVRAVVAYGGVTSSHQASQIRNGTNILVATPGRLIDFVNRGYVGLGKVRYLILDEADRMLDMGFMPDVRKIVEQLGIPEKSNRQTLMFSATFPKDIQELASEFLNDYLFLTVGMVGGANQDVKQTIVMVDQQEKREKLVELLNESTEAALTLVFVELKRSCDFLASFLSQSGFRTTSIHGDRLQREREEALVDFKKGKSPILVATSVAARGLDIPKVSHVINYDMPSSIDEYVHRIGRTGRCGNIGRATSFFDLSCNMDLARALVNVLQSAHQDVPDFLENAAQNNMGSGRFGSNRGFQSRDARLPRYGGRSNFDSDRVESGGPSSEAGMSRSTAVAADEDSWD